MGGRISRGFIFLTILSACFGAAVFAQNAPRAGSEAGVCDAASGLNGVFRIDVAASDKLYSVIEGASTNIPYGDQQLFFIDLAARLTPPDLLAIECRGTSVSLASSRAPRVEFRADGVTRSSRDAAGRAVRSRIRFEGGRLVFTSGGAGADNLSFAFAPEAGGSRLRVTRRLAAPELIEPIVIQTVYQKLSDVARWDVFEDPRVARSQPEDTQSRRQPPPAADSSSRDAPPRASEPGAGGSGEAGDLRRALDRWIDATNRRDIAEQMSFYAPRLRAFYLTRDTPRADVRAEKNRVFRSARSIDIRAAEPEIIFQDGGRTAVMRFRKKYDITAANGRVNRGEVIQELRWQRGADGGGWRIFSERDIRVLR